MLECSVDFPEKKNSSLPEVGPFEDAQSNRDHPGLEDATLPPFNGLGYVRPTAARRSADGVQQDVHRKNVPKTSTKEMCPQDVCCAEQDLGWHEVASVLRGPFPPGTLTAAFPGLTTPRRIFRDLSRYENIIILSPHV